MSDETKSIYFQPLKQEEINAIRGRDQEILLHYRETLGADLVHLYQVFNLSELYPTPFYIIEAETGTNEDYSRIYCTIGMSHRKYPYDENWTGKRNALLPEYITYSIDPARSMEIIDALIKLMMYPLRYNSFLDVNHTMEFADRDTVIPSTPMTTAVFAPPFYQPNFREFSPVHYSDKTFTPIIWFIPTYTAERKFFREKGMDAFFNLVLKKKIDLADWGRPSAVKA